MTVAFRREAAAWRIEHSAHGSSERAVGAEEVLTWPGERIVLTIILNLPYTQFVHCFNF